MRNPLSLTCLDEITAQPDIIAMCALIAKTKNTAGWNAMTQEDRIILVKEYLAAYKTIYEFVHANINTTSLVVEL